MSKLKIFLLIVLTSLGFAACSIHSFDQQPSIVLRSPIPDEAGFDSLWKQISFNLEVDEDLNPAVVISILDSAGKKLVALKGDEKLFINSDGRRLNLESRFGRGENLVGVSYDIEVEDLRNIASARNVDISLAVRGGSLRKKMEAADLVSLQKFYTTEIEKKLESRCSQEGLPSESYDRFGKQTTFEINQYVWILSARIPLSVQASVAGKSKHGTVGQVSMYFDFSSSLRELIWDARVISFIADNKRFDFPVRRSSDLAFIYIEISQAVLQKIVTARTVLSQVRGDTYRSNILFGKLNRCVFREFLKRIAK